MKISIIVPVYNIEKYLPQCVESLLAQTYNDIEILLIDDGSTDGSAEIADQYAEHDERVRVFHQPNGGISAARNKGLDVMTGDYVMFVDGDDFVSEDYCQVALDEAIEHQVDVVAFGYYLYWEQGDILKPKVTSAPKLLKKEEAIRELIRRREVMYNYAWNKIFKSRLFKDVRFPVGLSFEDVAIMHLVFDNMSTGVYLSNRILYYYRKDRQGSVTSSLRSTTSIHDRLVGEFQRLEFIRTHYPALERHQFGPIVEVCFQGLTLLPSHHEDRKVMKRFLNANKDKCLDATYGERRKRLWTYYYMKPLFYLATFYVKRHYYGENH